MQTQITAQCGKKNVVSWLHRAGSKSLVVFIHGHNSSGERGRSITLAKEIERLGVDCLRFSAVRDEIAAGIFEVTTVSEELQQVKAVLSKVRSKYTHVVAAGHSQGAIMALQLANDGYVDGVVDIMGVAVPENHVKKKLAAANMTLEQLRSVPFAPVRSPIGFIVGYTTAWFEDFLKWDVLSMLAKNKKPILFVQADNDESVSAEETAQGFTAANEPKELFVVQDTHRFSEENALLIARKIHAWMHERKLV